MTSDTSAHHEDIAAAGAGHGGGDGGQSAGDAHPGPDHQGGDPVPAGDLHRGGGGQGAPQRAALVAVRQTHRVGLPVLMMQYTCRYQLQNIYYTGFQDNVNMFYEIQKTKDIDAFVNNL